MENKTLDCLTVKHSLTDLSLWELLPVEVTLASKTTKNMQKSLRGV
jgi:hypothetical protein